MVFHVMTPCKPCNNLMYRVLKILKEGNNQHFGVLKTLVIIVYKPLVISDLIYIMKIRRNLMEMVKKTIEQLVYWRIIDLYNLGRINCLEVVIWGELLPFADGQLRLLNVIKEVATVKVAFTMISLAVLIKNVKWKHPYLN